VSSLPCEILNLGNKNAKFRTYVSIYCQYIFYVRVTFLLAFV